MPSTALLQPSQCNPTQTTPSAAHTPLANPQLATCMNVHNPYITFRAHCACNQGTTPGSHTTHSFNIRTAQHMPLQAKNHTGTSSSPPCRRPHVSYDRWSAQWSKCHPTQHHMFVIASACHAPAAKLHIRSHSCRSSGSSSGLPCRAASLPGQHRALHIVLQPLSDLDVLQGVYHL